MVSKLKKKIISSGPMPHGRGKFKKPKPNPLARKTLPYKYKKPLVKKQFAGRIATGIKKQMLDPLKAKAAKRTATATSVSKVQQDGIIRRFARDNGKAAAIKKFGADRVAKVSISTKRIG